jgi:hydrogenase assembly chaperone HypC/HupF
MCIAAPGRVIAVDASGASVDVDGRVLRASTLVVPDIRAGDWVTVAAGTILERMTAREAAWIRTRIRAAELATAPPQPVSPTPTESTRRPR